MTRSRDGIPSGRVRCADRRSDSPNEPGGKRSFFSGEYGKYGLSTPMAPSMGSFDMLAQYFEAIGKMTENPLHRGAVPRHFEGRLPVKCAA